MSGCSIPLVIMEMQIKITMRCYCTPTRRAKIKQNDNISISTDAQQAGPLNTGVNAEKCDHFGKGLAISSTPKHTLPKLTSLLSGIYS